MLKIFNFFKSEKPHVLSEEDRKSIKIEIDECEQIQNGINVKWKEVDGEFYITAMIDKRIITIESEANHAKTPNLITFLVKIDCIYPNRPPYVFAKSNFTIPTLMDGRDLMPSILPNWNTKMKISDIIKALPGFVTKVINTNAYKFYGCYHLGSVYDLHNFDMMLINIFTCKVESQGIKDKKSVSTSLNTNGDYSLILTGDAILLFDKMETGNGKIVFWGT